MTDSKGRDAANPRRRNSDRYGFKSYGEQVMPGLKAIWMPHFYPEVIGLSKKIGDFWIEDDERGGSIKIGITAPAEEDRMQSGDVSGYFASMNVHYDGVKILQNLEASGFLSKFEEMKASTFYDIFQIIHSIEGISLVNHDSDLKLIASRRMYETLTEAKRT